MRPLMVFKGAVVDILAFNEHKVWYYSDTPSQYRLLFFASAVQEGRSWCR